MLEKETPGTSQPKDWKDSLNDKAADLKNKAEQTWDKVEDSAEKVCKTKSRRMERCG
jgi:hypothetical protein